MPCDTIATVNVELGKVNLDLMESALKSLGLNPYRSGQHTLRFGGYGNEWIDTATGECRLNQYRNAAELKRTYSAEVVKSQAKRFGWQLKETGKYQYEIIKR